MPPAMSALDVRYLLAGYAKQHSDVAVASWHRPDLNYLILGEFCHAVFFTALWLFSKRVIAVKLILAGCAPFQIRNSIVGFVSVPVVGFGTLQIRTEKSDQHQTVDQSTMHKTIFAEGYSAVAIPCRIGFEDLHPVAAFVRNCSPNPPQVADGVIRKFLDWLPKLGGVHA